VGGFNTSLLFAPTGDPIHLGHIRKANQNFINCVICEGKDFPCVTPLVNFCRATLCISAAYAVARWLAVTWIVSKLETAKDTAIVAMECE